MNNQSIMMPRAATGLIDANAEKKRVEEEKREREAAFVNSFETANNGLMVRRSDVLAAPAARPEIGVMPGGVKEAEAPAAEKNIDFGNGNPAQAAEPARTGQAGRQGQSATPKTKEAVAKIAGSAQASALRQVTTAQDQKAKQQETKQPEAQGAQASRRQQPPQAKAPAITKIRTAAAPDDLAKRYADAFKSHFGLELSMALCYDNMRKLCEPDVKDPLKTLYYIENTYRLSTLLYIAGNLPIIIISTVFAEKNRKNVLGYVRVEVENAAKPYDDVRKLRTDRWARKYGSMAVNDAVTVTPGVTALSPELASAMQSRLDDVCDKMKKFDRDLAKTVAKMDDAARHDVAYIYSNFWYLLQAFENVPEARSYIMTITDDTRKNFGV